jgi:hypothetical protein
MTNSFNDALKANAKAKTTTKKSTVPVIETYPKEVGDAATKLVDLKAQEKTLKAEINDTSSVIIEFASKVQDEHAFNGDFHKSYAIGDITYVSKNQFSINTEDAATIKKILGKAYSSMILEKMDVKLKEEVFESEALQKELMSLLGDTFSKFFDVATALRVCEDYDKKIYDVLRSQDKINELRVYVKPYSPSLK